MSPSGLVVARRSRGRPPGVARVVRGLWGVLLLTNPDLMLRLGGGKDSRGVRVATRILGARHLVEAVVLSRASDDRPRDVIAGIDAAHAVSMLTLAAVDAKLRRDALLSAASACGLVALSLTEE